MPFTGFAADHFDRRKLLLVTQSAQAVLALGLGLLTVTGVVQLWHVYVFAFLLGCVTAFDAPARQTFVAELVSDRLLSNAVALNSTSFNAARMIGPAIAGLLIAGIGTGWVFLINSASFVAVIAALACLRVGELTATSARRASPAASSRASATCRPPGPPHGAGHALPHHDVRDQFPGVHLDDGGHVFHAGSGEFGLLSSMLAIGSVTGACSPRGARSRASRSCSPARRSSASASRSRR